jgi:hypothetical protein
MFCSQLASEGNLEGLILARDNGCPWDKSTCDSAAENGHLHASHGHPFFRANFKPSKSPSRANCEHVI